MTSTTSTTSTTGTTSTPGTTGTTDLSAVVEAYLSAWNTTDADARSAAVATVFAEDARYADPLADVTGREGIAAVIAGAQAQFPGLVFAPYGVVDGHHDQVRFSWGLGHPGDEPLVVGSDVAVVDDEGRITLVLGFLDRVPTA